MALLRRGQRGHELFPGFTDVSEIGVGSLAVVFRAREIATNRHVALKLLNVRDASPQSIESFERESVALGALSSHPNIVTLYRTFRTPDGRPVLVLELCSGAVYDRMRAQGSGLPVADGVSLGIKIAGALETAHRGGILHRDVKPQNILITEFGEPALADFGVAMLQSATQTTAGLFDFTTLHAAPELLEGSGTSAATDVYELASSLYQLIAGQSAFRAYDGESPASVILRILRDPVRPLSGQDVPMALSDLLIRAMSKEKDERPPTAAEFAAELADVEIAQGWHRTQFLIRDPGPLGMAGPTVTRMPDRVPRTTPPPVAPAPPAMRIPARVDAFPPAVWAPPPPPADYAPRHHPEPAVQPVPEPAPRLAPPPQPEPPPHPEPPALPEPPPAPPPRLDDAPLVWTDVTGPPAAPVPVWAVRAPATGQFDAPQFSSDLSLEPMSLRAKMTLRAGAAAVTVTERQLRLRNWLKRSTIEWTDVDGFEAQLDPIVSGGQATGRLVALTPLGPIELPGTRRPVNELRHVHALLAAYRIRAARIANSA